MGVKSVRSVSFVGFCGCGVFLLCGIGKGVTEGNGFAFFTLLSGLDLSLSFGFKLFFVVQGL